MGRIARAHGVRGTVRIVTYLPESRALQVMKSAVVGGRLYGIQSARSTSRGWLIALRGVRTREQADALRGQEVAAIRSELPPLGPDEWYAADLVGLVAVTPHGAPLGVITEVANYGAGDILVVGRPGGSPRPRSGVRDERMIPLAPGVLRSVHIDNGIVVVAPPEVE